MRQISGTRVLLPEPWLAWTFIVVGVLFLAFGTLASLRVRSHMWGGTRSVMDALFNLNKRTPGYFLHEYDEPDKWLLGVLMVLRVPGTLLVLWGIAGLAWTG